MALTAAQASKRDGKLTGSFFPQLCAGNETAILDMWQKLIGDPAWREEDLSDNWAVQLGSYLEPFALDWHERKTQHELTRRGEVAAHPTRPHVCCTLDAYRAFDRTVLDVKCTNPRSDLDELLRYYSPQLLVQMECTGAHYGSLLIVHGGGEPQELQAHFSTDYVASVWSAADAFWRCVETLTPPVAIPPVPPPPDKWRAIDLDTDAERYNWSGDLLAHAQAWALTREAAQANDAASKLIKQLTPLDVGSLLAGPIAVKRNRAGALSIKER